MPDEAQPAPVETATPDAAPPEAPAEAAEAPAETEAVETPAEAEEQPKGSAAKAWAQLAKRERKLSKRAQEIEQRDKTLAEREREAGELRELLEQGRSDPWPALESLGRRFGVRPQDIVRTATARALKTKQDAGDTTPLTQEDVDRLVEERVTSRLTAWQEEQQKTAAEQAEQQRQRQIETFKSEINDYVAANPDKYEVLIASNATGRVFDLIEAHWKATSEDGNPVLLTKEQAADILEEQFTEQIRKLRALKKFQEASSETEPTPETQPETTEGRTSKADGPRTLTNGQAATISRRGQAKRKTERERLEAAVRALERGKK